MQWLKPTFKSSLMALLGSRDTTPSTLKNRTEDIRLFILDELGEFGEKNYPKVIRHVRYALDAQGLWYARGDVMAVLAAVHGEYIAREKVGRITEKFEGLLPRGLTSRPSPLTVDLQSSAIQQGCDPVPR
ncbi:MAG: hypothetical protein HHJ16_06380 [Polaromonas sp.]|uniref:hypothetical protein n=1 Tax=Polaromonas sp. TaxID=1869339 RepID=UPI0017926C9F|nr:hypothetical protein [Polaromonas sp.]NMM09882.1 hypothetical protein [Polaromonas sp.]